MGSERQLIQFIKHIDRPSLRKLSIATTASWLSLFTTQVTAQTKPSSIPTTSIIPFGRGQTYPNVVPPPINPPTPVIAPISTPPPPRESIAPIIQSQAIPDPPAQQIPPATIASPVTAPTSPTQERILVTIDPGHGGKDPGAIGLTGLKEIDVILPIAQKVATILREQGIEVQMTRDDDYFVGLDERVVMSRQAGATLFVSIHANSIDNRPDVHGLETYHYNLGADLAQTVHETILEYFNVRKSILLEDRRVRSARFLVLRKSSIPAILVETGYLSSPEESPKLGDIQYQTIMGEAIAQGILNYLKR